MRMVIKLDCPLCPKQYQSQNKLEKHCEKVHGITYLEAMKRKQSYNKPTIRRE